MSRVFHAFSPIHPPPPAPAPNARPFLSTRTYRLDLAPRV